MIQPVALLRNMRPSAASVARDASRLCSRCRLQTRRASSLAAPNTRSRPQSVVPRYAPAYLSIRQQPFSRSAQPSAPDSNAKASPAASPPETYYGLFPNTLPAGPPPGSHFPIDTRALRREFLQLQARAHPDMHAAADKARAEATSALINEAYRTLANPLLRAQYLLSLRGVDVANDETLKVQEPGLLMLVLEAREEIEDATEEEELVEPRRVNDERIRASEEVLEQAFRDEDIELAKSEAVRLRYWVNIKDSLDNWEKGKPVVLEH